MPCLRASRHKAQKAEQLPLALSPAAEALALLKQITAFACAPPQRDGCPLSRPLSVLNGRRPGGQRVVAERRWGFSPWTFGRDPCPGHVWRLADQGNGYHSDAVMDCMYVCTYVQTLRN
jgi:hypothetical protein